tara:strand:- start:11483 stop:12655 length:1173 start_codon:yes stop_codon:yes gene_type:complete
MAKDEEENESPTTDPTLDYLSGQLDRLDYFETEISSYNEFDLSNSPMSVIGNSITKSLAPNIFANKRFYPAIVLMPFMATKQNFTSAAGDTHMISGLQACKAICPTVHTAAINPFSIANESKRAIAISHFPTFVSAADLSAPLVPGCIIEVSFDNPWNHWGTGTIRRVIKARPNTLPEWAGSITQSAMSLFGTGAPTAGGGYLPDPQNCNAPRSAQAIFEAYKSVGSQFMNIDIANKIVAVANSLKMKDPGWLANVIYFETARSFDPSIVNPIGATGLIQFTKTTASGLGTTTISLAKMSSIEQLDWVEKYFKNVGGVNLGSQADVFAAVFMPVGIGKGPNFNIYNYFLQKKGAAYADNVRKNNNGLTRMGQYTNAALKAAKLTCPENLS